MTVKALMPVRMVNLVAPLAHKATDMHTTETAATVRARSGAAASLIGSGLRGGCVDSAMGTRPTPGIATSTTATRTTTTRATKVALLPSADPHLFSALVQAYLDCRRTKRNSASALTWLAKRVDVLRLSRISQHSDLAMLSRVYYRATAAEIAAGI